MIAPFARGFARPLLVLFAVTAVTGILGGCSATKLTDLWKDPNYTGPAARKVLIISMSRDATRRRMFEDAFATAIQKQGATATASYTLFPGALPDTGTVKQTVLEDGYDGVIVTHFIGTENVERFVPPTTATMPVVTGSPWGTYRTYYDQVAQPGYVESDRVVRFQTDVWLSNGTGGRLVWMARSETVNPSSPKEVSKEVSGEVVPELKKVKLL